MAFNSKLFHLGNNVVALARKYEKTFPRTGPKGSNELGDCFIELLDLVNQIRLAIQDAEEEKSTWIVKFEAKTQEMLAIREQLEVLELKYEINPITDQKCTTKHPSS
jgi:hypothetical protein